MIDQLKTNIQSKGSFNFSNISSSAWNGFKANAGSLIGFLIVSTILFYAGIFALILIPIIGWVILLTLANPVLLSLFGGFYIVGHKISNNENIKFNDYFQGFQSFSKIFVLFLITFLADLPINLISYSFMDLSALFDILSSGSLDLNSIQKFSVENQKIPRYISIISNVYSIFLSCITIFALPAIITSKLGVVDAIKVSFEAFKKYWIQLILSLLFLIVVNIIGALCCGLGLLVTAPFSFLFIYFAYKNIALPKNSENTIDQMSTFGIVEKDINTEAQEEKGI